MHRIAAAVTPEQVDTALLAGSRAAGLPRDSSDVDVLVVLARSVDYDEGVVCRDRIVDAYFKVHAQMGYTPDREFPGEVLLASNLDDVLAGAAFRVTDGGILRRRDLRSPYRFWLSMTATGHAVRGEHHDAAVAAWCQMLMHGLIMRRRLTMGVGPVAAAGVALTRPLDSEERRELRSERFLSAVARSWGVRGTRPWDRGRVDDAAARLDAQEQLRLRHVSDDRRLSRTLETVPWNRPRELAGGG